MRLIDADALIKSLEGNRNCSDMPSQWIDGVNCAIDIIELYAPIIDAVEVVRCRECKRWTDMGEPWGECRWSEAGNITLATTPDDYCSNGVRR